MINKEQAINASAFHREGQCWRRRGPRGGITQGCTVWRRNGSTQTWKTRPEEFKVPVKFGLKHYDYITQDEAGLVHAVEDCPLSNPNWYSEDLLHHAG